jgi:hypothetical protein
MSCAAQHGQQGPQDRITLILELSADPQHHAPWPAIRRLLKAAKRAYGLNNRAWVHRKDLDAAIASGELVEVRPADPLTKFLRDK